MHQASQRWLAIIFGFLFLSLADAAAAAQRIALVIGNAAYEESPLFNPVNDAIAVDERLTRLGFEVIRVTDADLRTMQDALVEFARRIEDDATALVFYAGHGIQANGRNYLVPVDARLESESALRFEALELNDVLEELEYSPSKLNLVVLDACRNNPFLRRFRGGSRGLAAVDAATGTLIAYATGPGAVASDGSNDNGLYTEHFLDALDEPGLQAEAVFKRVRIRVADASGGDQVPWESSSLTGDFVFNRSAPPASVPPVVVPGTEQGTTTMQARVPEALSQGAEVLFWDTVREAGDIASFEAYLAQFPDGTFAPLAKARIEALRRGEVVSPDPVATEDRASVLEIRNDTGATVVAVQASASDDTSWGADWLRGDTLPSGSNRRFELPAGRGTRYDVRLRDTDGDTYSVMGYDLARGVLRVTVSDLDAEARDGGNSAGTQSHSSYYVEITNRTGFTITRIDVSHDDESSWGEDRLGTDVLANGASRRIDLVGYPNSIFDIRLTDSDGDTYTYMDVDVALRDITATLGDLDGAGGSGSTSANTSYYVDVTNETGFTIFYLYVSPVSSDSWGDDVLGTEVITTGGTHRVDLSGHASPMFDIRLTDEDGDTYTFRNVDVSKRDITATLADIDS